MSSYLDAVDVRFIRRLKVQERFNVGYLNEYGKLVRLFTDTGEYSRVQADALATKIFETVISDYVESNQAYSSRGITTMASISSVLERRLLVYKTSPFKHLLEGPKDEFELDVLDWLLGNVFRPVLNRLDDALRGREWHVATVEFTRFAAMIRLHQDFRVLYFQVYIEKGLKHGRR